MNMANELGSQIRRFAPPEGQLSMWWLHQSGFVLKTGGKTICIDLFFSDMKERVQPPIMAAEDLRDVDYILGTHDHIDHIDRDAWPALAAASPRAKFLVPRFCLETLRRELPIPAERLVGVGEGRPFEEDGLRVAAVPSAHELLERDEATGEYAALGYVISCGGFTVYHAGDCCVYEGLETRLKQAGEIDVMMLPITGRCANRLRGNIIGNMTYQEAVDLAGAVRPRLAVPMHYDSYTGNLENPLLFLDYLHVKYPHVPGAILRPGERFDVTKAPWDREEIDGGNEYDEG